MALFDALGVRETGIPKERPNEQYNKVNRLGFTGKYQVGEALLQDLGYYQCLGGVCYLPGGQKTKNTWDGNWKGKNGLGSYQDLLNNKDNIQEIIIRDAFKHNERIIEAQLEGSLDSVGRKYGRGQHYTRGGILAGAHLCGPYAVIDYFKKGTIPGDENGTLITAYMEEFSQYSYP